MSVPYIDLHTHRQNTQNDTIALRNVLYCPGETKVPAVPYSIGLHPWNAGDIPFTAVYRQDFLNHLTDRTLAIGESGLDYVSAVEEVSRKKQCEWFEWQLQVAVARNLPVVVHCVKAYNDLIELLKEYTGVPIIIHGYTGSPELTNQLLGLKSYFSLGFGLLKSPKTQRSLLEMPVDRFLLETDEAEGPVSVLYDYTARLLQWPEEKLKRQLFDNYTRIFNPHDGLARTY